MNRRWGSLIEIALKIDVSLLGLDCRSLLTFSSLKQVIEAALVAIDFHNEHIMVLRLCSLLAGGHLTAYFTIAQLLVKLESWLQFSKSYTLSASSSHLTLWVDLDLVICIDFLIVSCLHAYVCAIILEQSFASLFYLLIG